VACAARAPSGGNAQPWRFVAEGATVTAFYAERQPVGLLNFGGRATPLALGAALENACVAAEALGFRALIELGADGGPVAWSVRLERVGPRVEARAQAVLHRSTNRRNGPSAPIGAAELEALRRVGLPAEVDIVRGKDLAGLADAIAELDRVQFVSSKFHGELFSEIRWTPEEARSTRDGLDVASLELSPTDRAALEVVRSAPAMDVLRSLDLGRALGNAARTSFREAAAALVLSCRAPRGGPDRVTLLDAGRGLERLWLEATARGISIHPWGSPFLFQRLLEAPDSLDAWERTSLRHAAGIFGGVVPLRAESTMLLVLRLFRGAPATAFSLRRDLDEVLTHR
jgi:nitroreductase